MAQVLSIRNRQRLRPIDLALLRRIARRLLDTHLETTGFELCLHLVDAAEMSRVNQQFLQHEGSTDVITFDHSGPHAKPDAPSAQSQLHGEIYLCLADALTQAARFRTTWQLELTRYVVHGFLHLRGHDDRTPVARRRMKRAENRLVRALRQEFPLAELEKRAPRARARARRRPAPLRS